jgi:hypothetical protein
VGNHFSGRPHFAIKSVELQDEDSTYFTHRQAIFLIFTSVTSWTTGIIIVSAANAVVTQ